jgi:hypothetical protein
VGRQVHTTQPRLAWNSWSYCLNFPNAGITGLLHHTWLISSWGKSHWYIFVFPSQYN